MVFLSPRSDLVFKKLFGTPANKELTMSFLNSVLERLEGQRIVELTFNDPNNHLETLRQKFSIVDIRCTDENGYQYIIEMQNQDYHNFGQRAQYYGACGLATQLQVAEEYGTLLSVIFVGVVDYVLFDRHNRYITHHHVVDCNDQQRDLALTEYHFIELPKFNKEITHDDSLVDKWIYFLKNAGTKDEIPVPLKNSKPFPEAFHVLTQSAWTPQELELYRRQLDALRVEKGVIETALEKQALEIARNLLAKGIDVNVIMQTLGLSLDAINKLKKGN